MAAEVFDNLITPTSQDANPSVAAALNSAARQIQSDSVELEEIRLRIDAAEQLFNFSGRRHASALSFGIPLLVAIFAMLAAYWDKIFGFAHLPTPTWWLGTAILWFFAFFILLPVYYYRYRKPYNIVKAALLCERQAFLAMRLSTKDGRKHYYRQELIRLSSKAARVFFGDEKRFKVASQWSETAGNILDSENPSANMGVVQSCINSLNELVAREEQEQADEVRWQKWAIAVMLLFIALLGAAALVTTKDEGLLDKLVFGVPFSVILWGAAGSLAAILYRFYTEQGQIRFASEFRWLIARPIIGVIMGAVVNLAIVSGLVLISAGDLKPAPRREALWIIAFLAGFSDKFYLGVIDLLVARTVRTQEIDSSRTLTEKDRTPGPNAQDGPGEGAVTPSQKSDKG